MARLGREKGEDAPAGEMPDLQAVLDLEAQEEEGETVVKSQGAYARVAVNTLVKTGLSVVFEQTLRSLSNALHVICVTELEAAELQKRAGTDHLKQYWRGRRECAWSIRRHANQLEEAIKTLEKLVPVTTNHERSSREDLKKVVREAKRLRRSRDS